MQAPESEKRKVSAEAREAAHTMAREGLANRLAEIKMHPYETLNPKP